MGPGIRISTSLYLSKNDILRFLDTEEGSLGAVTWNDLKRRFLASLFE